MSPKRYPPLTPDEVIKILQARGFHEVPKSGSSHVKYEGFIGGKRRVVTVDVKEKEFGVPLMHSIISQSGLSREEFYNTLKKQQGKYFRTFNLIYSQKLQHIRTCLFERSPEPQ